MSAFDNATLMITGGTGSFGSTVLKHFLDSDLKEIRIFSRDEKKQDDMRHELPSIRRLLRRSSSISAMSATPSPSKMPCLVLTIFSTLPL